MSGRSEYSAQGQKIISKEDYLQAKKIVEKYISQQAKIKSGEYYKKGKQLIKTRSKNLGNSIVKFLTTK